MKLYTILGVDKSATPSELKKAYRDLCKIHHPDKGGDEDRFKEISEAYEVLSDPERRARYDETGEYKKEKPFEAKFMGFVSQVIMPVIESGRTMDCDLFRKIFQVVNDVNVSGKEKLKEAQASRENVEEVLKRMKRNEEGQDLMREVLTGKLSYWDQLIAQIESELLFLMKCEQELRKYDYEFTPSSQRIALNAEEAESTMKNLGDFLRNYHHKG